MEFLVTWAVRLLAMLLYVAAEILLQAIGEWLLGKSIEPWLRGGKPAHPVLAALGFVAMGAFVGAVGVWLYPHLVIRDPILQIANMLVVPFAVGLVATTLARRKLARGMTPTRFESFRYSFLFAFTAVLVRWILLNKA